MSNSDSAVEDSAAGSNIKHQFLKTKLCPFQAKGFCLNGSNCTYAHSELELRPLPDLHKTKLCDYSKRGVLCPNRGCTYAHTVEDLKPSTDLVTFKTALCFFWRKGKCLNGDKCRFAHGINELRTKMEDDASILIAIESQLAAVGAPSSSGSAHHLLPHSYDDPKVPHEPFMMSSSSSPPPLNPYHTHQAPSTSTNRLLQSDHQVFSEGGAAAGGPFTIGPKSPELSFSPTLRREAQHSTTMAPTSRGVRSRYHSNATPPHNQVEQELLLQEIQAVVEELHQRSESVVKLPHHSPLNSTGSIRTSEKSVPLENDDEIERVAGRFIASGGADEGGSLFPQQYPAQTAQSHSTDKTKPILLTSPAQTKEEISPRNRFFSAGGNVAKSTIVVPKSSNSFERLFSPQSVDNTAACSLNITLPEGALSSSTRSKQADPANYLQREDEYLEEDKDSSFPSQTRRLSEPAMTLLPTVADMAKLSGCATDIDSINEFVAAMRDGAAEFLEIATPSRPSSPCKSSAAVPIRVFASPVNLTPTANGGRTPANLLKVSQGNKRKKFFPSTCEFLDLQGFTPVVKANTAGGKSILPRFIEPSYDTTDEGERLLTDEKQPANSSLMKSRGEKEEALAAPQSSKISSQAAPSTPTSEVLGTPEGSRDVHLPTLPISSSVVVATPPMVVASAVQTLLDHPNVLLSAHQQSALHLLLQRQQTMMNNFLLLSTDGNTAPLRPPANEIIEMSAAYGNSPIMSSNLAPTTNVSYPFKSPAQVYSTSIPQCLSVNSEMPPYLPPSPLMIQTTSPPSTFAHILTCGSPLYAPRDLSQTIAPSSQDLSRLNQIQNLQQVLRQQQLQIQQRISIPQSSNAPVEPSGTLLPNQSSGFVSTPPLASPLNPSVLHVVGAEPSAHPSTLFFPPLPSSLYGFPPQPAASTASFLPTQLAATGNSLGLLPTDRVCGEGNLMEITPTTAASPQSECAQNKMTTSAPSSPPRLPCSLCGGARVSSVFLPCGHAACCSNCSANAARCPTCTSEIRSRVPISCD